MQWGEVVRVARVGAASNCFASVLQHLRRARRGMLGQFGQRAAFPRGGYGTCALNSGVHRVLFIIENSCRRLPGAGTTSGGRHGTQAARHRELGGRWGRCLADVVLIDHELERPLGQESRILQPPPCHRALAPAVMPTEPITKLIPVHCEKTFLATKRGGVEPLVARSSAAPDAHNGAGSLLVQRPAAVLLITRSASSTSVRYESCPHVVQEILIFGHEPFEDEGVSGVEGVAGLALVRRDVGAKLRNPL